MSESPETSIITKSCTYVKMVTLIKILLCPQLLSGRLQEQHVNKPGDLLLISVKTGIVQTLICLPVAIELPIYPIPAPIMRATGTSILNTAQTFKNVNTLVRV